MSVEQSAVTTNHSFATAEFLGTDSGIQSAVNASIAMQKEEDYYSFTLTEKKKITLATAGTADGDTQLYLYNSAYEQIAFDDDSGEDGYSQLAATLDAGTYYVKVKAYGSSTIPEYSLNATVGNPAESNPIVVTTSKDVVNANDGVTSLREALAYAEKLGGEQTITFSIDGSDSFDCETTVVFTIPQNITVNGINLKTGNKMQRTGRGRLDSYGYSTITDIIHYSPITYRSGADMYFTNSTLKRIVTGNYADILLFSCSAEDMELQYQGQMLAYDSEIRNLKIGYQGVLIYSLQNIFSGNISVGGAITAKVDDYDWAEVEFFAPSFSGTDSQVSSDACINFDLSAWTAGQVMTHFANDTENNASGSEGTNCSHSMLIDNMKVFTGAGSYTVSVKEDQALGVYQLAGNAADFTTEMSLSIGETKYTDVLTVGNTFSVNNQFYKEALNSSSVLTLDVENSMKWNTAGSSFVVEYSKDNFNTSMQIEVKSNQLDSFALPGGDYQWRVRSTGSDEWQDQGSIKAVASETAELQKSEADGVSDIFFAKTNGVWEEGYSAQHTGAGSWEGTGEQVLLQGKNKLIDVMEGSTDANILVMTDDANGDALFVDDIYTAFPDEQQSRLAQIDEIRAGAGDDVVDMTSQRFTYVGDGVTVRGGDGDDVIWANAGDNKLFGDTGDDRLAGASGNDVFAGGSGDDSMLGGGGDDIFCFSANWGSDFVQQSESGTITLWFASGSADNWNAAKKTYTDGTNSVKVSSKAQITLKFGDDGSALYDTLLADGAFMEASSEKIYEESGKGVLAKL